MDATINTISILAETETTSSVTWALLMGIFAIIGTALHFLVDWLKDRGAKAETKTEETEVKVDLVQKENDDLNRRLLLSEIKSIGQSIDAANAEMRSEMRTALASIKSSMERHDTAIDDIRRQLTALNEWKIAFEAKMTKGGVGAA